MARADGQALEIGALVPLIIHRGPKDLNIICHELGLVVAMIVASVLLLIVKFDALEFENEAAGAAAVELEAVMPLFNHECSKHFTVLILYD